MTTTRAAAATRRSLVVLFVLFAAAVRNDAVVYAADTHLFSSISPSTHTNVTSHAPSVSPTTSNNTDNVTHAPTTNAPTPSPANVTHAPTTAAPTDSNHTSPPTVAPPIHPPTTISPTTSHPPDPVPSTPQPTSVGPTPKPAVLPTSNPTQQPSHAHHPKKRVSFLRIIGKTIAWLIIILLSVVAFGAIMSHRYRIYYFLRTCWYYLCRMECTLWILSKLPFPRSSMSVDDSLNTIIFDNEMNEGLLMRESNE